MKSTPIMFTAENLRATFEGRKTVTRRLWGLKEINKSPNMWELVGEGWTPDEGNNCKLTPNKKWMFREKPSNEVVKDFKKRQGIVPQKPIVKCPYGSVGDLLRVKELWSIGEIQKLPRGLTVRYNAKDGIGLDLEQREVDGLTFKKYSHSKYYFWQSPMFMPRFASRQNLLLTSVRPERLWDITEADAEKEGIDPALCTDENYADFPAPKLYAKEWDLINGKTHPWSTNPWVWRLEYKLCGGDCLSCDDWRKV